MLDVSALRNVEDENQATAREMESFCISADEFPDFSNTNLLDTIDLDDLFVGMDDGDLLPDLEMDPEILAEFSIGEDCSDMTASLSVKKLDYNLEESRYKQDQEDKNSGSGGTSSGRGDVEVVQDKRDDDESRVVSTENPSSKKAHERCHKTKKSFTQSKNSQGQGKKKVKVDWTPELHRRFVQAVEQQGVDKAVPSRSLELMGSDCLTRHNIASHLQKYRSHRKHLLAREAEAASWSQRRQMYGSACAGGMRGGKREGTPWLVPAIGFPPMTQPPLHHFRPVHVWGHPTLDQSSMHMWPKHLPHSPSPPPPYTWPPTPAPPPPDTSYWHHCQQRIPNAVNQGATCLAQALTTTRFASLGLQVPGIPPPQPMLPAESAPLPPFDFHPSKESIDAAIGEALAKPWQPLPLGLKPPSLDSVLVELERQGIPKIHPSSA